MTLPEQIGYTFRMATGLRKLLRTPVAADPLAAIRRQMENREEHFLRLAQQVVFASESNPYRRMFETARCSHEDLADLVRRLGLEQTLAALHREGVWLAHDEFKGKKPIVRAGREIPSGPGSFRNPFSIGGIEGRSGGSRSAGTQFVRSVRASLHHECYKSLLFKEFGGVGRCQVMLKPILPATDGVMNTVYHARLGCRVERWFSPVAASLDSTHYRFATGAMFGIARLHGLPIPYPSYLSANDFSPVAEWLARRGQKGEGCTVMTHASPAVRVASAAREKGFDLHRTVFLVGGETLTDAKRRAIEQTGALVFPMYATSEFGSIGYACREMTRGNCVHLFHDSVAVISYPRIAPLSDTEVHSLLFTTLFPYAPFFLINAEMDDSGLLGEATCDCTFRAAGFHREIRDIFSFGKLTGQGVTLIGTEVLRILEEVLPKRFGGCATDYQLVERDGSRQAALTLRVSRRLQLPSLDEVRDCFLKELRGLQGGSCASRLWRDTQAVTVVHEDPFATARGKILPLHLLGLGEASGSVSHS